MQKKIFFFNICYQNKEGIEEVGQPESERTTSTTLIFEPEKSFGGELEKKKNILFLGKSRVLLLSEAMLTVISISAKTGQMSANKTRLSNCNF